MPVKHKIMNLFRALHPARLSDLAAYMLKDEAISGKLIVASVALALIATNTSLRASYESLWYTNLSIGLGQWSLSLSLRHWVNDGLMTIFFLVVGLELKRELIMGELHNFKTALLPITAAIGGMATPALIYMVINSGGASFGGWAIPMATDIAIVIGLLALLGSRIPSSVRLFLLTLAIVDDIAAIIVIAVFYSTGINVTILCLVAVVSLATIALQKIKLLPLPIFVMISIFIWLLLNASGVHPSIAGALVGLLAPLGVSSLSRKSIAERLERFTIPISTLLVVPLFAFANAGITISLGSFRDVSTSPIATGVILGLVLGKFLGVAGMSWLIIKLGFSKLPTNASWSHMIGVALLAGIGFTVSIFVADLAFEQNEFTTIAKLSIVIASIISALLGLSVLRYATKLDAE